MGLRRHQRTATRVHPLPSPSSPRTQTYSSGSHSLASEVQTMEMDAVEYVAWGEAKDSMRMFEGNGRLFLDLDAVLP